MADTLNRQPLWWAMHRADQNVKLSAEQHDHWPRYIKAAEIRALRDWLVPEEPLYDGDQRWELERDERQRLRALLTTEADRAERGNV